MRILLVILMLCSFSSSVAAVEERITGRDIPQVLGVWYGVYQLDATSPQTEIWIEISFQKPINGYEIHGYNRWNVLNDTEEEIHGAQSLGRRAQQFDTVSGRIAEDGVAIELWEDHSQARLHSQLLTPNQMMVEFVPKAQEQTLFKVVLNRIDTHYEPNQQTLIGVDVSHHSGSVDWPQVIDQGYRFAYIKASEGVDNPDAMFEQHWQALAQLNFPRGAYHFYVTEDDPEAQARFFASRLKNDTGTLPPVVDVEYLGKNTHGDMTATLLKFLQVFEQETGVKPMIYTTPAFWDQYYRPEFSDYALWLSEVGVKMPKVPFGWKIWNLWQNKVDKSIQGVEKTVDISILHPSLHLEEISRAGQD